MGLTWIVGLVAALVDMEEVWFAFVVLNTTQGLFIFASFTCNKKVGASLKARLCGGKHTYRPGMAVTSRRTRQGIEIPQLYFDSFPIQIIMYCVCTL